MQDDFSWEDEDDEVWDGLSGDLRLNEVVTEEQFVYMALDTITWAQEVIGALNSDGAKTATKIVAYRAFKELVKEGGSITANAIHKRMDKLLTDHIIDKMVVQGLIDEDIETGLMTFSEKGKKTIEKLFGMSDWPFEINPDLEE